jgi:hypothetical protein
MFEILHERAMFAADMLSPQCRLEVGCLFSAGRTGSMLLPTRTLTSCCRLAAIDKQAA